MQAKSIENLWNNPTIAHWQDFVSLALLVFSGAGMFYLAKKHAEFFLEKLVKITYIRERYYYDILRFPITPIIYLLYWIGILENTTKRAKKKYAHYEISQQ
jgi:hypothetical protein